MERLFALTFLLLLATFSAAELQLQSSLERPCPGEYVVFTCALESTAHRWEVPSLGIIRSLTLADQDTVFFDPPFQFAVTEVVTGTHITSTATVNATADLNGTLVLCRDGNLRLPDQNTTINIIGPPTNVPSLSCVVLSEDVNGTVNVTVSWTLSGGDSADFYLISITTNAPQTPYGGLLNITTASVTQHELTGFMSDYEYNITVRGVNCGSQEGRESEPLTIILQGGTNVNILNVKLDTSNPANVFVECIFFQPGYTCTIDYGTDPSYTNLVYRDTSSTHGQMATITLSRELHKNTNYYYIVSVMSSTQCVRVQGRFRTECTVTDLTDLDIPSQDEVVDPRCTERGFMSNLSITDGVVCYDGTTAGSRAVYICNNVTQRDEFTRVCLRDGNWNGSIPSCPDFIPLEQRHIPLIVISAIIREFAILYAAFHEACENMKTWHIVLIAVATIYWIFTVGFWIAVAVVTSNTSDANACDPSCHDRLILSGLVIACGAMILIASVVVNLGYHNRRKINRWQFLLIGIAAIFWIVGMTIWCVMGVIVANPPDGNTRDPGWQLTRDGLIHSGLLIFIVATIFIVVVILFQAYYRRQIDKMELWQIFLILIATTLWVIGVLLWIAVGVVVANPPYENTRDPGWQRTRDGLIYFGLVISIVVIIFTGAVVSVQVYRKQNKIEKKWLLIALLVISTILSVIGVGLWIALAVVVSHGSKESPDGRDDDPTSNSYMAIKNRSKESPDGRDDDPTSNSYMAIKNIPKWMFGMMVVLLCLTVVGIPIAIVMIAYINCNTKKGASKKTSQPVPYKSEGKVELKDLKIKKEGASHPPVEALEYGKSETGVKYESKAKEEKETGRKKKGSK